jgi:hypothetical protein
VRGRHSDGRRTTERSRRLISARGGRFGVRRRQAANGARVSHAGGPWFDPRCAHQTRLFQTRDHAVPGSAEALEDALLGRLFIWCGCSGYRCCPAAKFSAEQDVEWRAELAFDVVIEDVQLSKNARSGFARARETDPCARLGRRLRARARRGGRLAPSAPRVRAFYLGQTRSAPRIAAPTAAQTASRRAKAALRISSPPFRRSPGDRLRRGLGCPAATADIDVPERSRQHRAVRWGPGRRQ